MQAPHEQHHKRIFGNSPTLQTTLRKAWAGRRNVNAVGNDLNRSGNTKRAERAPLGLGKGDQSRRASHDRLFYESYVESFLRSSELEPARIEVSTLMVEHWDVMPERRMGRCVARIHEGHLCIDGVHIRKDLVESR